jgi:hypothetical protein
MALFRIFGKGKKKGGELPKSGAGRIGGANEETSKLAKAAAVRLEAQRADKGGQKAGDGKTKFWRRQIPLGQLLIRKGMIQERQLEEALKVQKERRKASPTGAITESYLGRILIDLNFIEESELAKFLSVYWQIPFVELANVTIRKDIVGLLSGDIARKYCVFPLHKVGRTVVLAMFNPTAQGLMEYISKNIGFQVKPAIATRTDILQYIEKFYPEGAAAPTEEVTDQVKGPPLADEGEEEDVPLPEKEEAKAVPAAVEPESPAPSETARMRIVPAEKPEPVAEKRPVAKAKPIPLSEKVEEAPEAERVSIAERAEQLLKGEAVADAVEAEEVVTVKPVPLAEEVEEVEEVGADEVVPVAEVVEEAGDEEAMAVAEAVEEIQDVEEVVEEVEAVAEELEAKATPAAGKGPLPIVDGKALSDLKAKLAAGEDVLPVAEKEPEPVTVEAPVEEAEEEKPLPAVEEEAPLAVEEEPEELEEAEEEALPVAEEEPDAVAEEEPEEEAPLPAAEALAVIEELLGPARKKPEPEPVAEKEPVSITEQAEALLREGAPEEEEAPLPVLKEKRKPVAEKRGPAAAGPVAARRISEEEFSAGLGRSLEQQVEEWLADRFPREQDADAIAAELFDLSTGARL